MLFSAELELTDEMFRKFTDPRAIFDRLEPCESGKEDGAYKLLASFLLSLMLPIGFLEGINFPRTLLRKGGDSLNAWIQFMHRRPSLKFAIMYRTIAGSNSSRNFWSERVMS